MTMGTVLGVDFGTTNTVFALLGPDGRAATVPVAGPDGPVTAFRSVLSFREEADLRRPRTVEAGPWAIAEYIDDPQDTRFIQSFKSFAASPHFQSTEIHGRRYRFEDLLWSFLERVRVHAGGALVGLPETAVIGRPVQFAGSSPDPNLAIERYEAAFRRLGFARLHYVFEPVGAAFYFAQRLAEDAAVLVADFGGGTSDFSVIRFERGAGRVAARALGHAGVPVAGDAFDYRIIDNVISPELGKGSEYRSFGKLLPIPSRYYAAFARWSQLALLKSSKELRDLKSLARTAVDPRVEDFVALIEGDHGYPLYRAVSGVKEALSGADAALLEFRAGAIDIRAEVARSDFERWIAPELFQIERALEEALDRAGLSSSSIDRVFLTGGSSLVPAVRRLFEDRFGANKIAAGAEFESIAGGLALIGNDPQLAAWSQTAAPG